jgi:hypothetical protein
MRGLGLRPEGGGREARVGEGLCSLSGPHALQECAKGGPVDGWR